MLSSMDVEVLAAPVARGVFFNRTNISAKFGGLDRLDHEAHSARSHSKHRGPNIALPGVEYGGSIDRISTQGTWHPECQSLEVDGPPSLVCDVRELCERDFHSVPRVDTRAPSVDD